jgi:hypothetical protein
MKKPTAKAAESPRNPLIDPEDTIGDNMGRVHAFAVFLQTDAMHAGSRGMMEREEFGRYLAHEVLTDALEWLQQQGGAHDGPR